jgi:hypothetical protein
MTAIRMAELEPTSGSPAGLSLRHLSDHMIR